MGGFFLLFDVTMDVSQDKCILGKLWESPVTRTTHIRPDVIHCDVMDWSWGILCVGKCLAKLILSKSFICSCFSLGEFMS